MILEIATVQVVRGQTAGFEAAFREAEKILHATPGYLGHELQHCMEDDHRYVMLIKWETREAHTVGFRQSPHYQTWSALLHHFYVPFPTVEHFVKVD